MKLKNREKNSISAPLLKQIGNQDVANRKCVMPNPTVTETPLEPAELDQDSGSGYNVNHVYPQE